jgi:hypothetical protein
LSTGGFGEMVVTIIIVTAALLAVFHIGTPWITNA